MRKRLAVIGGGAHTIPSYQEMLKLIANEYQITVFSEFHLEKKWEIQEYVVRSVSSKRRNRRWNELTFFFLLAGAFMIKPPHVIHSHSTYPSGFAAVLLGWFFRIPVVVCLDAAEGSGIPEIKFGDLLNRRRKQLNAWVMKTATIVTALTRFQMEEVRSNLSFHNPIRVIPRGVDPNKYITDKVNDLNKPLRFLSVAYLHPVKDHETMLRTFHLISQQVEATLTLVGQDYTHGSIQQLTRDLNIDHQVRFIGFVPHDQIANYYRNSDILLHTSQFESQAMAVVEAMAAGVLVCGTHVGIMADLSGECCITVPPKAYDRLAQQVLQLIAQPDKQKQLRSAAQEWVNTYSLKWTVQQYLILYQGLIR